MSKKFGKLLLFSAMAGAAAYGAYQYLQNKDKTVSPAEEEETDDDFDDFSEDLDDEPAPEKERSYVSLNLDKAAAIATESFHKAKDVISNSVQQVRDTVKSVTESQVPPETNFTDLTALQKEAAAADADHTQSGADDASSEDTTPPTENVAASENTENVETVQEESFFDDDEETDAVPVPEVETAPAPDTSAEAEATPKTPVASGEVEEFFSDDTP